MQPEQGREQILVNNSGKTEEVPKTVKLERDFFVLFFSVFGLQLQL